MFNQTHRNLNFSNFILKTKSFDKFFKFITYCMTLLLTARHLQALHTLELDGNVASLRPYNDAWLAST